VLEEKKGQSRHVYSTSVDSLLMITILAGIALSVVNLILALVNGRSKRMAEIKATAGFRELYQRTYKRGRRLVSSARPGKTERRSVPRRLD
jgi:hypothetical protein